MKRIAIFCDGTWNRHDAPHPTNVVRLHAAAQARTLGEDGVRQLSFYLHGVGAEEGGNRVMRFIDHYAGGAFGAGLDERILRAYRFLIRNYQPGDQVFIFGFSRGAYTARSLVGLIRNCGVMETEDPVLLDLAMTTYRSRRDDDAPFEARVRRLREWLSPHVATDAEDRAARPDPGACTLIRIAYLGIFDTVGALGVPGVFKGLARVFNGKYQFHDTRLSAIVAAARHAISIDDRRATYPPTLWAEDSIDWLNRNTDLPGTPYQQLWFPGVHSTVGGGNSMLGIANATALWIAEGAAAQGLAFDPAALAVFRAGVDPGAAFYGEGEGPGTLDRLTMRSFPYIRPDVPRGGDISTEAGERWRAEGQGEDWPYRPKPLRRRADELGWPV